MSPLDLDFTFERTGFKTGKIKLQQIGEFTNYTISRLLVSIIVDNSFGIYSDESVNKCNILIFLNYLDHYVLKNYRFIRTQLL
jgi:hypothetical protein